MTGLKFIIDTFKISSVELGEILGVSKQTINDWVKKRKTIPEARLNQLVEHFGLERSLFKQDELTEEEMHDIKNAYVAKVALSTSNENMRSFFRTEASDLPDDIKEDLATILKSENIGEEFIVELRTLVEQYKKRVKMQLIREGVGFYIDQRNKMFEKER